MLAAWTGVGGRHLRFQKGVNVTLFCPQKKSKWTEGEKKEQKTVFFLEGVLKNAHAGNFILFLH